MVLSSFLPFVTYMIMTFLAFYNRTPAHVIISQGALFCDFLVWSTQSILPTYTILETVCEGRTTFRISSETAIAIYFSISFLCLEIGKQKEPTCVGRLLLGNLTLWYIANAVLSCYSQVYLKLSSPPEVAVGAAVGTVSAALLLVLCQLIFIPRLNKPWCQYIMMACLVQGPWLGIEDEPTKSRNYRGQGTTY